MRGWDPVGVKGGRADKKEEEGEREGEEASQKRFSLKMRTLCFLSLSFGGPPPGDLSHTPQPPLAHPFLLAEEEGCEWGSMHHLAQDLS